MYLNKRGGVEDQPPGPEEKMGSSCGVEESALVKRGVLRLVRFAERVCADKICGIVVNPSIVVGVPARQIARRLLQAFEAPHGLAQCQ